MTAYRQESGTWYVKFRYTDWTGKRRQTTKRGFKTKRDALKYEREQIASAAHSPEMTVGSLCDEFLTDRKPRVRRATYINYEAVIRHYIRPKLGETQVKDVTPAVASHWQAWVLKTTTSRGEAYAPSTLQLVNTTCRTVFRWAERMGYFARSPFAALPPLGHSVHRDSFYEVEEYQRFIAAGREDDRYDDARLCFDVLFYSGLRIAEFYGLGGEDIDYEKNLLHVRKACGLSGRLGNVKNQQSVRDVPMPPSIMERIHDYTSHLMEVPDHRIWPLSYGQISNRMKLWADRAGLPRITPHGLRHSHVSYLISLGVPLIVISRRVGHANPNVTLRVYSHMYRRDASSVGSLLESAMKCGQSVVKQRDKEKRILDL